MIDSAAFIFADPKQVWLESPLAQTQEDQFSTPSSRWNGILNSICLNTVLPWLRAEYAPQARVWSMAALPSFWEIVNGTAIDIGMTRLVLIPSETIDISELRVPQEWVDIPSWAADYYVAVQVNSDEGWVRIWGYTTHQQLKTSGHYDPSDRTYSLDAEDLILDLNVLWVARQLCPQEPTRGVITPLPALPLAQAENLLQRLGDPALSTPRLEVPFELWGALLEHGGWRQRLYERRQGLPEQWSILQWLQAGISNFAQQIGWQQIQFQPNLVGARGVEQPTTVPVLSRQLIIADQAYQLQVLPQGNPEEHIWRFQLLSSLGAPIPSGFKLRLLTEDLQTFANNEDTATTAVDRLYIEVALESGEGLVWEIEPVPENYNQEILRF